LAVFVPGIVFCVRVLIDVLPAPLVLALVATVFGLLTELGPPVVEALFVGAVDPGHGGGQNEVTREGMVKLVTPLMTAEGYVMLNAVWTTLAIGSKTAVSSVAVISQNGNTEVVIAGIVTVIVVVIPFQSVVVVTFPR
jgi:hypothetical protein